MSNAKKKKMSSLAFRRRKLNDDVKKLTKRKGIKILYSEIVDIQTKHNIIIEQ